MPDLLILIPTRGRPTACAELATAFADTDADVLFCVDDDDPELPAYRRIEDVTLRTGPRLRLGPTLNAAAVENSDCYSAIGFMGDDHRPRTVGWEHRVLNALDDLPGPGIVYGDDLVHGAALPTAAVLDARIIRALGRMVPEGLVHLYLDNYWRDLGLELGTLRYLPDVVIEHLHPIVGKAEWTPAYEESNAWIGQDQETYRSFVAGGGLHADAATIRAAQ